jgi:hypothetical protein
MKCELCGAEAQMDFNCWMPSFGEMVEGDICFDCFTSAPIDMELAVALIKRRAENKHIEMPMESSIVVTLFKRSENETVSED